MKRLITLISIAFFVIDCNTNTIFKLDDSPYVEYQFLKSDDQGAYLKFALVLPECFSDDKTYPVLLVFPPGEQNQLMAEGDLENYWITSSIQKGWIVVSPITPDGTLFFEGSEKYIPDLMEWMRSNFNVEGNKFHVAGASNGGRSAFRIALDHSEHIQSIIAYPGYPPLSTDYMILDRLKYIPINMYVGEHDADFLGQMNSTYNRLREVGCKWARFQILSNEGHVLKSLTSEELFRVLESARPK